MSFPYLISNGPIKNDLDHYIFDFFKKPFEELCHYTISRSKPGHFVYLLPPLGKERFVVKFRSPFSFKRILRCYLKGVRLALFYRDGLHSFSHIPSYRWKAEERINLGWKRLGLPCLEVIPTCFSNIRVTRYVESQSLRKILRGSDTLNEKMGILRESAGFLLNHYQTLYKRKRKDLFHMEPHTNNILITDKKDFFLIDAEFAPNTRKSFYNLTAIGFIMFYQSVLADTGPYIYEEAAFNVVSGFKDKDILQEVCYILSYDRFSSFLFNIKKDPLLLNLLKSTLNLT